jgi:DNA-binding NtrC family response regulator
MLLLDNMGQTNKKEILICDDDPSVVSIFEFILGQSNFHVFAARTFENAIVILKKKPSINLMLLQLNNADKNSLLLLDKTLELCPKLPILAIISNRFDNAISQCYERGAYGIIHKPFDIEEVVSIINEVFTNHIS